MTPEAYLDRVRALLPALRERTARAEQLRRLPDETFADFQEAGLFRALQPRRYGGYELDRHWKDFFRIAGRPELADDPALPMRKPAAATSPSSTR